MKGIDQFMYLLGVDPSWYYLVIALSLLLGIVNSLYPWQPRWKAEETTEDKDGNKVTTKITTYYRIRR